MSRKTEEFNEGAMWETGPWEVAYDVEITKCSDITPCRHCGETYQKEHKRPEWMSEQEATERAVPRSWFTTEFRCPRVVIAKNYAGHATTGVCLDCILDAVR